MSQNHTHDKDLLDRIERAASEKQPGGLPVLDDLARTVPQAKPAFQQQLESHLVAHLYTQPATHQEDSMETLQIAAPLNRPTTNRRVTIPATLVATLIMVLLGGSILLILRSPQQGQTGAALIQATATPFAPTAVFTLTATPFAPTATFTATPILPTSSPVPLSTTRRGIVISLIGVKVHETPDIESQVLMTLAYESAVQVIGVSLNGMWLNILLDDGRQAWIVSELVEMDSGASLFTPTIVPPDMMATLPFTLTPTAVPLDIIATLPFTPTPIPGGSGVSGLVTGEAYIRFGPDVESPRIGVGKAGDRFEVIARYGQLPWLLILYSDAPNGVGWVFGDLLEIEGDVSSLPIWTPTQSQLASTIRDLRDILNPMREWKSVIIARQNIQRGELITADMLGEVDMPANLAPENTVSQMSRLVGQYAAESIQPWQPIRREQVAAEFNANTLPAGTVAVSVPTGELSDLSGIEAGNTVDVVAVLLFTGNDPAAPGSIPVIVLPGDPASLTAESFTQSTLETTTLPGKLRMERIVQGALVVRLNANTVTLAVPVEQAATLTGLVDAEVPMLIVPIGMVNLPAN